MQNLGGGGGGSQYKNTRLSVAKRLGARLSLGSSSVFSWMPVAWAISEWQELQRNLSFYSLKYNKYRIKSGKAILMEYNANYTSFNSIS